ncbi:zonadhesin-like [Ascaphus truei]|uniref:zonadhesin-like n=1 Tax=Ascaphus truei TaxID=8439 RepID=UPI003F5A8D4A
MFQYILRDCRTSQRLDPDRYKPGMGLLSFLWLLLISAVLCQGQSTTPAPLTTDVSCPPNTKYGCKRNCFGNCDNLNSTTEACILSCWFGCDCIDGYVFKSRESNVCVPPSQCNVSCPEHMHFDPCLRTLRPTCDTLGKTPAPYQNCEPRCVCDEGYIFDNNKKVCRKISECPQKGYGEIKNKK